MTTIDTARKADYAAMQSFMEDAYGKFTRHYFPLHYPWCWGENNVDYDHIYLIRDHTQIVSLVRVFPLEFVLGGARVKIGGIGNVGTAPATLGKGYMSRLLNHAIGQMRAEKFPLSILWGDQHRYQPFGYQTAGKMVTVTIALRGLEKNRVKPLIPTRFAGEEQLFLAINKAYQAHVYHRLRTKEEARLAYQHTELLLFCGQDADQWGYLGLFNHAGVCSVAEFGGDAAIILRITAYLLKRLEITSLAFSFPNWYLIPKNFVEAASAWRVDPVGQLKILDLQATIQCFCLQAPAMPSTVTSDLQSLPETEQVNALFGTANNSPLNVFVWPLDNI